MVVKRGKQSRIFCSPYMELPTPVTHHFRPRTMGDADAYLLLKWEQNLDVQVQFPAHYILTYEQVSYHTYHVG